MAINTALGSRLAFARPDDTAVAELFEATLATEVTRVMVCNVSAGAVTFRLFHTRPLENADEDHALFWDFPLAVGASIQVVAEGPNSGIQMEEGDKLHARSSSAGAITFTLYGVTTSIAPGATT